ncbi:UDP glucose:glycoprotein glucosyltransferase [Echinococcus multilocularis]|uniref:UDP glucose:glycoprotein glucosyltransferase n=1 Tax=Echinococcus multilocularis TaxID=6211 RepID=A0A068XYM7_ECHMU|nr:UDP glucose:glycoprotein glucosyltransferase [Echinococcus multilocularis]
MNEGDLHTGYEQADDVEMQSKGRSYSIKKTFKESSPDDADGGGGAHCHSGPNEEGIDKVARRKLLIASALCLIFMIGEATGGALASSLAIMTDAAHLLTDFASFLISLFAIFLSGRPATRMMSFGWYRAEVVGALVSVLLIWLVTGILVYLAIIRVIHQHYEIDGKVMLITSAIGVAVNMVMAATLHQHGHDHGGRSHGHNHESGSHIHSHGFFSKMKKKISSIKFLRSDDAELVNYPTGDVSTAICGGGEFKQGLQNPYTTDRPHGHHSHKYSVKEETTVEEQEKENINVRAAFIHVIGDLLQSLGVMIAAFVIYFRPEYKIADPICTFIFSVLVLLTTVNILKDAMNILMEGVPKSLNFAEVRSALQAIPGIVEVHNLRMWSLTTSKTAVSVHLATGNIKSAQEQLVRANRILRRRFLVHEVTIQMEQYVPAMAECRICQELKD